MQRSRPGHQPGKLCPWLTSCATTVTDRSACIDCGKCVDRCQFAAREMSDGSLAFHPDLCYGCGLCVSTCPTYAIVLVDNESGGLSETGILRADLPFL